MEKMPYQSHLDTTPMSVHAMKRSKPSAVDGGGEMNRDTSSDVSSAKSEAASDARSSRRTTCVPVRTGKRCFQSQLDRKSTRLNSSH